MCRTRTLRGTEGKPTRSKSCHSWTDLVSINGNQWNHKDLAKAGLSTALLQVSRCGFWPQKMTERSSAFCCLDSRLICFATWEGKDRLFCSVRLQYGSSSHPKQRGLRKSTAFAMGLSQLSSPDLSGWWACQACELLKSLSMFDAQPEHTGLTWLMWARRWTVNISSKLQHQSPPLDN